MDQEAQDAKLIVHLSEAFNKDEVWQLAAAEAWSKATSLERVLIRDSTAAKQLKLVDVLIRKTLAAGLGAGSAAGAGDPGAAAGLGVGSAAIAGPPPCKLRLRQDSQNKNLFFFEPFKPTDTAASAAAAGSGAGGGVVSSSSSSHTPSFIFNSSKAFYLDPTGQETAELRKWLRLAEELHCAGAPIVPLFINGPVKSGKSYMLNEVLPAVANTYYCSKSNITASASAASDSTSDSAASDSAASDSAASVSAASDSAASASASASAASASASASATCDSASAASDSDSASGGQQQQQKQQAGGGAMLSEPPNFLRVTCLGCDRNSGVGGFLAGFLRRLKQSAADQQLSAAASTPEPSNHSADAVAGAIQHFMRRLPRDRLNILLIDEAQSFYLIERCSTLDVDAVRHMRRLLKELMLDSPPWVAWAVTGSSMATLWANVAATPTNGFALIMHHFRLNLSHTVPMDVMQVAWERLRDQHTASDRALPLELVWQSPPQVAMLAFLCKEWRYSAASTAAELVEKTMTQKLIPEVLADLRMVLQVLGQPAEQLLLRRELLDPLAGVEAARLPPAFEALLGSFATKSDEGRLYLDYPLLAHVLQAVTTESGELLESITAVQSHSSRMFRELVVLGECCKAAPQNFDSYEELRSLLEEMAAALKLQPGQVLAADWFMQVLDHRLNSRGAKANFDTYFRAAAQEDVKVGLRGYHGLLCNVLSHGSISEQRQALQAYPEPLAKLHTDGRISKVLTKTYNRPRIRVTPSLATGTEKGQSKGGDQGRNNASSASAAAATPSSRAQQPQLHGGAAGHVRPPVALYPGKRLPGRAAVAQPRGRYMVGRMRAVGL